MFDLRQGDCLELIKDIPDNSIDLTVTSPPYDNLRTYTGVACKNLNRNFIGIELDEKYFNIAKERIENTKIQESLILNDKVVE